MKNASGRLLLYLFYRIWRRGLVQARPRRWAELIQSLFGENGFQLLSSGVDRRSQTF